MSRGTTYPRYDVADFAPGLERKRSFVVTRENLAQFADVSGDYHPLHQDLELAQERGYPEVLIHGMLVASRCSAFVAHDFVGTHGLLVSMTCDFRQPVFCGQPLAWRGRVTRVTENARTVEIGWQVTNEQGLIVQRGTACALLSGRL